jgi:hypothetical protein
VERTVHKRRASSTFEAAPRFTKTLTVTPEIELNSYDLILQNATVASSIRSQADSGLPTQLIPVAFRVQITLSFISIRVIDNARNEVHNDEGWGAINPCCSDVACSWGDSRGAAAEESPSDRVSSAK